MHVDEVKALVDGWKPPWFLGTKGMEALRDSENYLVLDFEATNKQYGTPVNKDNYITLACWLVVKPDGTTKKKIYGDEYDMAALLKDIAEADFLVAQNAQYELGWLMRCGLDLHDVLCYDTMVSEWVIVGNKRQPFNLEYLATKYGYSGKESLVSKLIKMGVSTELIPKSWLIEYCHQDVHVTHQVFLKQREKITELDLWHIVLTRNLTIPVLAELQANGLELDSDAVKEEEQRQQDIVEELGEKLDAITGGINLNSPKQLSKFLYETMGFEKIKDRKGVESNSTDQKILAQLVSKTDEQRRFLELYKEYNKANTLLTKALRYMKGVCDHMGGKFYGAILHCRTQTHRLAGGGIAIIFPGDKKESKFQLQNIPRAYKKLFTAKEDGYEVMEFDGAGMEFRTAAIIGRDKQAEEDIVGGADVHAFTRDTMNAAYERFKKKKRIDRQEAKSSTFTPLFWGNGKDEAEKEYAIAFALKYHGIREEQQRWILEVADKQQLRTPYGMIYYWPHATMQRSGWVTHTNEIVNAPIQGLATAEMIPIALIHFYHRSRGLPIYLFNTVHDSGVVRYPVEYREAAKQIAKVAMTTDIYNFLQEVYNYDTGTCPLGVGLKWGTHWGVSDVEWVYDVWKDGHERLTIEEPDPETGKKSKKVKYDTRQTKE